MDSAATARPIEIDQQTTARWLTRTLAPARAELACQPSAEAVERIRARLREELAAEHARRTLAA
jgi:hypothetical protein